MPVHAFRAANETPIYGVGSSSEAQKYLSLLNRHRDGHPYKVAPPTDGEIALNAGKTFSLKHLTVRLLLGK